MEMEQVEVVDEKEKSKKIVDGLKEATWKEYLVQEKPIFNTVFERCKAKNAFLEGVQVGMELQTHLQQSST
jgi:hypothetical protein